MSDTPELDKMAAVRERSAELSAFVDWLDEHGHAICTFSEETHRFHPRYGYEQLFADYFGIDLAAVDRERQQILDRLRELNAG